MIEQILTDWTHLIRFIALEDYRIYRGQPVDTTRDVGKDTANGIVTKAYLIQGTLFNGKVNKSTVYTVRRILSPIAPNECNYIRCMGFNYSDHALERGFDLPIAPILFAKPPTAIADPFPAPVRIPKVAQDGSSDYQGELCVVLGRTGRNIPKAEALDYVLGYTVANDVTARKLQLMSAQWCFGEGLDGSCPIGPVLVSPRVIPDPHDLAIRTTYNSALVQNGHTSDMIFGVRELISYLSQGTTLEAGSIILTGTPAGIGFSRLPPVTLEDGGDIRVEIERIGTLVNHVEFENDGSCLSEVLDIEKDGDVVSDTPNKK